MSKTTNLIVLGDTEYDISELECTECGEMEWTPLQEGNQFTGNLQCVWCDHIQDLRELDDEEPEEDSEEEEDPGFDDQEEIPFEEDSESEEEEISEAEQNLWARAERQQRARMDTIGKIPEQNMDFSELTDKQRMFCEEYLVDFNGTRAAKAAGYSEKTADRQAYENLRKPEIQQALGAMKALRLQRVRKSQDDVISELEMIKDRCLQAYPVYDRQGYPTGEWEFKENGAIKALELQGKHLGMFITQKLEHTGAEGMPLHFLSDIALQALSDKQLKQLEAILKTSDEWKKENDIKEPGNEEGTETAGHC